MAVKAVRQMRSPRSADFDMSRVVRPYKHGLGAYGQADPIARIHRE